MKLLTLFIAFLMLTTAAAITGSNYTANVQGNYVLTQVNNENITFYIKNDTVTHTINGVHTTYIFNTTMGNRGSVDSGTQTILDDWYLAPALAGNFTLINATAYFWIYVRFYGTDNNPNIYLTIYERNQTGAEAQVGTGSIHPVLASSIESYTIPVPLTNTVIPAGDTLHIHFLLSGGASTQYWVYYGNSTYASGISVKSTSHLTIHDIITLNYNGTPVVGFLENWSNKTMYINAVLNDPMGGYDIRNVSIKIIMPNRSVLLDKPMVKISGTPTSFVSVFQLTLNYSSLPEGNYTIIVYALDNSGYYYYQQNFAFDGFLQVGYSYFWIGLPVSLYVHLFDTHGNPLSKALITLSLSNATYSNVTDIHGFTKIELFSGTYNVQILWNNTILPPKVKVYYNKTYYTVGSTVKVSGNEEVNITAEVGTLYFRVLSSVGTPVYNALVYVIYPNNHVKIYQTQNNGTISLGLTAGGNYRLKVYYMDQLVSNSTYSIDFIAYGSTIVQDVTSSIYEVNMKALDSMSIPVQGEQIYVGNAYGQVLNITDSAGYASFLLPLGDYQIKAYYMGVLVNNSNIAVNGNGNLTVNSSIYYISMIIRDSRGIVVDGAYIYLKGNGLLFMNISTSNFTDFRVPEGNYSLNVYWEGVLVNSSNINAEKNINLSVNSSIYYLHIDVVGNDNRTIQHGWIIIEKNGTLMGYSNITNYTFRLPGGNYQIKAYIDEIYYLTPVNLGTGTNYTLSGNSEIKLIVKGYPPPFYSTYLFWIIVLVAILAILGAAIAFRFRSRGRRKEGLKPWEKEPKN
ncbi:MAG: hypothetical protein ACP5G5_05635 [Thermoplasmata archaeon]